MDFGWVGLDNLLSGSDNGETDADVIKRRLQGSGFQKQDDEGDLRLRAFKLANTNSSCPKASNVSEHRLPTSPFPFYNGASDAVSRSAGYCGLGGMSMQWGVRGGPFSPSQWMELEHQALIYKYITANVPIPSYLLNPIRKALDSSGFSLLRPNALGWGGFHLGFSNTDPEPGRCRRTDGKKWRCSRDAVPDQKYCERHINRGRHRSRKPVEAQPAHSLTTIDSRSVVDKESSFQHKMQSGFKESSEFGLVNSESLVNPCSSASVVKSRKSENVIREFMEVYPKSHSSWDRTQLSISIPSENEATRMGLSVGNHWVGGPLGEALHSTTECTKNSSKPLNLIDNWDHSPRGETAVAMASLGRA